MVVTCWLPRFKLVVLRETDGNTASPVPLKATDWGLPEASSVKLKVPERAPEAVGVKVTCTMQLAAAAKVLPHVVVLPKSPLVAIEAMFIVALPVFCRVTSCEALVVPTV